MLTVETYLELDGSSQALVNALQEGIRQVHISRYLIAAGCACLYLDYFLTLKYEVDLIWNARASIVKYGFLLFRYAGLASITLMAYATSGQALKLSQRLYVLLQCLTVPLYEVHKHLVADV
ncbi:hypothetical protein M422DRAFT_24806 [Sphaerobolus stellatus SS14]|nr:hypothetical protein M422DRAFT_24806 [Sphaerobolus stellatus SS14]